MNFIEQRNKSDSAKYIASWFLQCHSSYALIPGGQTPKELFPYLTLSMLKIDVPVMHLALTDERLTGVSNDNLFNHEFPRDSDKVYGWYFSKNTHDILPNLDRFEVAICGIGSDGHVAGIMNNSTEFKLSSEASLYVGLDIKNSRISVSFNFLSNIRSMIVYLGDNTAKLRIFEDSESTIYKLLKLREEKSLKTTILYERN